MQVLFRLVQTSMEGIYTCTAENLIGSTSEKTTVRILEYAPEIDVFDATVYNVTKGKFSFVCNLC